MAEIFEAVLALIGLGVLIWRALEPYTAPEQAIGQVVDPTAQVLESISARHLAADAAMRQAAARAAPVRQQAPSKQADS